MPPPNDSVPLADVKPHAAPDEPGSHPVNRAFDLFLVCIFVAVLTIPLLGTWQHWDFYSANTEKRTLAPFPETPHTFKEATKYSDEFFAYFKDHFGFRKALIHQFQDARFRTGLMTHNDLVLLGKDHWLFLCQRPDFGFLRERGFVPFTELELDFWQRMLEKRTAYFKSKGIAYVAFFAPDKQTIYPEYMPEHLGEIGPSRLDQLTARLARTHSPAALVDIRPAVFAEKKRRFLEYANEPRKKFVYFQSDTHWNGYGAFAGYLSFFAAVQQQLPDFNLTPQSLADFIETDGGAYSGDLVPMLGLDTQITERYPTIAPKRPLKKVAESEAGNQQPWARYESPPPAGSSTSARAPTLVMFHDSFGNFLPNLIGPHFRQSYFRFIDTVELEPLAEKPDIVITQLVERKLYLPVPIDPPEINDFLLPAASTSRR